jgi:high-affinity nickel-transport protein
MVTGGSICGAFVFFGILSVILYKPWRRWIEKSRRGEVEYDPTLTVEDPVEPAAA